MKPFIIRHLVYPIHKIITGRPVLKRAYELEQTQWLTREDLINLQLKKLKKLLIHSQENIPYYRKVFSEAGIDVRNINTLEDLRKIPILTKADIRKNQSYLFAENIDRKSLKKDSSGGSTGENVIFYHDKNCRSNYLGVTERNHDWCGVDTGELEVMIWGSAFDLNTAAKWSGKFKSILKNVKYISSYQMKSDTLNYFIDNLRKWKPPLITGYASALEVFARYIIDNNITDIKPKAVISSAEMLFPHQRQLIEKAFGCKCHNRYGCREFGTIAQECSCGSMHVNMERVCVETIPEDDCPEGYKPGELLVTDLDNFGFPMIRYRIGDMAKYADPNITCECGRGLAILSEVQGRTFDLIRTVSGRSLPGTFWTILTRSVPGINQFQIVQKSLTYIVINLKTNDLFPADCAESLKNTVKEYCGSETQVDINIVDDIAPGPSGKFRFVISEIKH
jgi:phenylacetate-CoA ligase